MWSKQKRMPMDIRVWKDKDLEDEIAKLQERRIPGWEGGFWTGMRIRDMQKELARRHVSRERELKNGN